MLQTALVKPATINTNSPAAPGGGRLHHAVHGRHHPGRARPVNRGQVSCNEPVEAAVSRVFTLAGGEGGDRYAEG